MAGVRILVVEDDGVVSMHVQESLKLLGYAIAEVAVSGEEAIQKAGQTQPDLVLMDIRLKGHMSGTQAAQQIRAAYDIPVVYLTAHSDDVTLQEAKVTDPFGYLLKPFEDRELHTTIEMALHKHRLDKALRESRQWLAVTLNSIGDAVIATDTYGCVQLMNPVAERLTGWPQAQAQGQPLPAIFRIVNEETHLPAEDPVAQVLREGMVVGLANHTLLIARNGTEIPIADSASPIQDNRGRVIGVVLTFRDVTERRQADRALRASEERYRQRSAELQALYDMSLRINAQLEISKLLGLIVEQAVTLLEADAGCFYLYDSQRNCLVLSVAEGYYQAFIGNILAPGEGLAGKVFESRRSLAVDDYTAWPERSPKYALASRFKATLAVPLLGKAGVLGVLDIGGGERKQDFSERDMWLAELFAAQAALALENARLHAEVQQRAAGLAALNKAGRAINSTLDRKEMLRLVMSEVRGLVKAQGASLLLLDSTGNELVFAAVTGPGAERLLGTTMPVSAGIAGWVAQSGQTRLMNEARDDTHFYKHIDDLTGLTTRSMLAVPLTYNEHCIGVIEAINKAEGVFEARDLEMLEVMSGSIVVALENVRLFEAEREQFQRLQESQTQLIHAEKMSAIGRLAASIAHEINNPLQAVQGQLELAGEEVEFDLRRAKLERYISVALGEVERVASIVRRMRDFYRPAREEMLPSDIHAVLDSVLALAGKQLQHSHVNVEREWADKLPLIQANPSHLKQVFLNLVLNAIDAMSPQGGSLCVRTALDYLPPAPSLMLTQVHIASQLARDVEQAAVRIEFSDTGKGMSSEVLSRLFEPFFTTKEDGTGLGLSISYGIIEAHGGQMTVKSQEGVGTTVVILLPAK